MRILVISNLFPDARQPTFGTFIPAHIDALVRAGADVEVVSIRGWQVHHNILRKYAGLAVRALVQTFRDAVRGRRPEIVEAHIAYPTGLIAWPVARLAGAKLVLYCHGSDLSEVGMRSGWHSRLARGVLRRADLLVANSRFTQDLLRSQYRARADRIVIWSPGINLHLFGRALDVERSPSEILYVGRLDPGKGVDVLIEAMSLLNGAGLKLRVVGDGADRDTLERLARSLGVVARFEGPLPQQMVARAMAQAAVVAVPSTHSEGLGLTALEGMASGALVVAAASGGLVETVTHGRTGWLVPAGSPEDLAAALRDAIGVATDPDASAAESIRRAARDDAAAHDVDAVAQRTLEHYRTLVAATAREGREFGGGSAS